MFLKRLLLLFVLLLTACGAAPKTTPLRTVKAQAGQALLTVYLSSSGTAEVAGQIKIDELAIEADGAWLGLGLQAEGIDYRQLKGQQQLLGAALAPLGEHRRLRLKVSGLPGSEESQQFILTLPEPLELRAGDSKCLFVDWQLVDENPGSKKLVSRFVAWGQGQTLGGELLYVACKELETLYIVRMDINEVVASFGVPGPLAEIRLHQRRLYILSSGKRAIFVYDCLNGRLVDQISLPGAVAPQHMALSTDGVFAFVSDAASGEVLKVDLVGGALVSRVLVGHKPQRLIYYVDGLQALAVVSPNTQQVFVLDASSLQIQRRIPVGMRPVSLMFFNRSLYVAEQGTQSVAVFDPRSGKQQLRFTVGFQPEYLQAIDQHNAYVSNSGETSLSALHAGQNVAIRRIPAGPEPMEWVHSQRKHLLYVANSSSHQLTVVDRISEKNIKSIPLGGAPTSLAVLE